MTGDNSTDTDEMLTIAEAAARLGIQERRLRHIVSRPEYAARTRQITRRTRSGTRQSAGLPPDLIAEIAADLDAAPDAAVRGDNVAQGGEDAATPGNEHSSGGGNAAPAEGDNAAVGGSNTPQDGGKAAVRGETGPVEGDVPAAIYRHRITDLEAQNAELRADKERLYGLLETAQANLQREQSLRLLTVHRTDPQGETQTAADGGEEADRPAATAVPETPGRKPGFWARVWGRKE